MANVQTKELNNGQVNLGGLDRKAGYLLRRAQSESQQAFIAMFSAEKIAPGQYSVFRVISLNPGIHQKNLAKSLGLDQSTLVPILQHLEKHKFIVRQRNESDRRVVQFFASDKGEKDLKRFESMIEKHEAKITKNLDKQERATLVALLKRVCGMP